MSDTIRIPLRKMDGSVRAHALIDAEDAHLAEYRWRLHSAGYANRDQVGEDGKKTTVYLHRVVLGLKPGNGLEVDHINHDNLDNRRSNLRVVTHAQNLQNRAGADCDSTSRHRGVSWCTRAGKWHACVGLNGRLHTLGYFEDEDEAARVASRWRAEHMTHSVEAL